MRLRGFRRWRRPCARQMERPLTTAPAKRGRGLLWGGVAGISAAILLIQFMNVQLRPVMAELAAAQVRNEVTLVIDQVVADQVAQGQIAYDDMIRLDKNADGTITALKSEMAQVNLLRSHILDALVAAVGEVDVRDMGIPMGNLTGVDLLSGRGPDVPVKALTAGTADASFENVFSSAGINQTRHQIMLNINVPVSILLPGYTTQTSVTAQVCVAETIIVGQVPQTYLQF